MPSAIVEPGSPVVDVCRQLGVSEDHILRLEKQYAH